MRVSQGRTASIDGRPETGIVPHKTRDAAGSITHLDTSPSPTPLPPVPPPLRENRSFRAFLSTQALGAFNDNVFKQVVLLLSVGYAAVGTDFQAVVQFSFALPFLLLSGLAGDLSDRYSKGWLMWVCKVMEIVVMLGGLAVFAIAGVQATSGGDAPGFLWALAGVTLLMGAQSAFFGPPKYGGLPELVREGDLPPATGLTQMTTFLAIIFGVATAGLLVDACDGALWIPGLAAVGIAVLGTWTARGIERRPAADPTRRIDGASLLSVLPTLLRTARTDKALWNVMLAYSWFWLVGGVCLTAANAYGRLQLGLSNFGTSLLLSTLSVGIGLGSAIVGRLSKGGVRLRLVVPGAIALVLFLVLLGLVPVHEPSAQDLERFVALKSATLAEQEAAQLLPQAGAGTLAAAFSLFFLLGASAGFFSVPLLSFIQARPAAADKGRVFAAVNWFNWVFILISALVYGLGMSLLGHRAQHLLLGMGLATAAVCLWILPRMRERHQATR